MQTVSVFLFPFYGSMLYLNSKKNHCQFYRVFKIDNDNIAFKNIKVKFSNNSHAYLKSVFQIMIMLIRNLLSIYREETLIICL